MGDAQMAIFGPSLGNLNRSPGADYSAHR